VKQKSLQRPPTIRFTDSVLMTRFLIIILRFGGGVGGGGGGGGCGGGDFNISQNSKICPSNTAIHQVQTLEKRTSQKLLNVETNFSPPVLP